MRKRARLARRILREHRGQKPFLHFEYIEGKEHAWYCPHCFDPYRPHRRPVGLLRIPRAYR